MNKKGLERVVRQDHKLEATAEKATNALAKHRWHWTLDESNEERMTFAEYARLVGRSRETIGAMANTYEAVRVNPDSEDVQTEHELKRVPLHDREIVRAVAKALGMSVSHTRHYYKEHILRVNNTLAEVRETEPDMTEEREREVIAKAAQLVAREHAAEKASKKSKKQQSKPVQWLILDGKIQRARDYVNDALDCARGDFESEYSEDVALALQGAADKLLAAVQLLKTALGDDVEIDWDAELEKLGVS